MIGNPTEKEVIKNLIILLITYVVGCSLNIGVSNKSDLITFLSIMIGFFMTAISLLFSSPLYKILKSKDRKGYANKWIEIVEKYTIAVTFSMIFILILLVEFKTPKLVLFNFNLIQKNKIYFSIACDSVYIFFNISRIFFKNLKFPVNQS